MKRVILSALLLVNVGVQCKEYFAGKSLEELKAVRDLQLNMIKEASMYAAQVKHERGIIDSIFERRNAACIKFKNNEAGWFSGISKADCVFAEMFGEMAAKGEEALRDADDKLEELIRENQLSELRLAILKQQDLEKSAQ
jgi:hypothetical protein